jgi:hypothetical protein
MMTIKTYIKENLALVIGLSLPIILIVLFFAATVIPKSMVPPPQYKMLFTVVKYDYANPPAHLFSYSVKDRKLMVTAKHVENKAINASQNILMAYDPATQTTREIQHDTAAAEAAPGAVLLVESTKAMELDTASVSPDGYSLDRPNYQDGGLVGGLFGGGYRNSQYRIVKGSVAYPLPRSVQYDYYNQVNFLGWIIKE